MLLILEQIHENVCSKTPRCRKLSYSTEIQNNALMHRDGLKG